MNCDPPGVEPIATSKFLIPLSSSLTFQAILRPDGPVAEMKIAFLISASGTILLSSHILKLADVRVIFSIVLTLNIVVTFSCDMNEIP